MNRLIQQALLQVLQPIIDPGFSEHSAWADPGRHHPGDEDTPTTQLRVLVLAVTSVERVPLLQDVPILEEAGLAGFLQRG
ncbi:MAG: hypothetical protein ABI216_12755 [Devosia sp.]